MVLLVGILHHTTDVIANLERGFYDVASTRSDRQPSDRIAVIAIDNASVANIGRWPWSRDVHAQLIDQLSAAGVKTIAHTAFFFEPQAPRSGESLGQLRDAIASSTPPYADMAQVTREALLQYLNDLLQRLDTDGKLAQSLTRSGRVILPSLFTPGESPGRPDQPLPGFAQRSAWEEDTSFGLATRESQQPLTLLGEAANAVAHMNQLQDADGVVREEALLVHFDGHAVPSMALRVAAHSLNLGMADLRLLPGEGVQLGSRLIQTDEQARVLTQFYADTGGRPAFEPDSFYDVLSGKIPASKYAGKIVIIGATADGVGTLFATPVSPALSPAGIVAHTTSALLSGHFIVRPIWTGLATLMALLVVVVYLVLVLPRLTAGAGAWVSSALLVALLGTEYALLVGPSIWLPLVFPASVLVLGHLVLTTRRYWVTEHKKRSTDAEAAETNRQMGLALLGQGQLDMAFDRFLRVPASPALLGNLQQLALDFERKRQFGKAESVYAHITQLNPSDAGARQRQQRASQLAQTVALGGTQASHPGGTLVLSKDGIEKPMLGRYQVEKELGKGAMGVVYQGRDPKIGRVVAIKTLALSAEFEGQELQEARERFFREAETAGRLQHPNIVTIFDAGEEHDLAYIAMEFLRGQDLTVHARSGQLLPPGTVLKIGQQVALALHHAHLQQVVHRDIKPGNIMFDPQTGQVKVTDFGIARITDASRTKTGMVLGTPSFMSPEQLAGQHIDGRSDLYALGVMLYQLLTGVLPFRGDSMAALMYQIANQPAPHVGQMRPELPPAVGDLLVKAMAKTPDARYQDGQSMAADLGQLLAGVGPEVEPTVSHMPIVSPDKDAGGATQVTHSVTQTLPLNQTGPDIRL